MTRPERALDLFARQFNCAQAVFAACGPDEWLDEARCLMLAGPFGGGIGRLGETCGAVIGALLVLGLRYGGPTVSDPSARAKLYERVREFVTRFKARNHSLVCRDLLGCDISTPEGWQQMQERRLHQTVCPSFVRGAVELLEEMRGE